MFYAKIKLDGGNSYVQAMDDLGVFIEEIQTAAECQDRAARWTVELVEMTPEEYAALPEFIGH
jgi:hypothetical protein